MPRKTIFGRPKLVSKIKPPTILSITPKVTLKLESGEVRKSLSRDMMIVDRTSSIKNPTIVRKFAF